MKILVCGGRNYGEPPKKLDGSTDFDHPDFPARKAEAQNVHIVLEQIAAKYSKLYDPKDNWLPTDIEIISGGADGADSCAVEWAIVNWTKWHEFPADWKKHEKAAGPIRNQQMLDEGKPDLVVAFPGGRGTDNMVKLAEAAGIPVVKIGADECQQISGDQKK